MNNATFIYILASCALIVAFACGDYVQSNPVVEAREEVEGIQDYLKKKGINVTEDEIIEAAIRIATRWGSYGVFVCELKKEEHKSSEKWRQ